MKKLLIETERQNNKAIDNLNTYGDLSLHRLVMNMRLKLQDQIKDLRMDEDRKSYFLHQLANVHSTSDLADLVQTINRNQAKSQSQSDEPLDLVKLTNNSPSTLKLV